MTAASMTDALEACALAALADVAAVSDLAVVSGPAVRPDRGTRVGVDVVLISDVMASATTFGASYLTRVYTAGELAECGNGADPASASRLAARFAAKEAVTKVLAPRDAPGWWRDIETLRSASGACDIRLTGAAAQTAEAAGLTGWAVSLTHEGDYAAAVTVSRSTHSQEMAL